MKKEPVQHILQEGPYHGPDDHKHGKLGIGDSILDRQDFHGQRNRNPYQGDHPPMRPCEELPINSDNEC